MFSMWNRHASASCSLCTYLRAIWIYIFPRGVFFIFFQTTLIKITNTRTSPTMLTRMTYVCRVWTVNCFILDNTDHVRTDQSHVPCAFNDNLSVARLPLTKTLWFCDGKLSTVSEIRAFIFIHTARMAIIYVIGPTLSMRRNHIQVNLNEMIQFYLRTITDPCTSTDIELIRPRCSYTCLIISNLLVDLSGY